MQWLRSGMIENGTYTIEPCERCLTPSLKLDAISRYLDNWKRWHDPQPEPQEDDTDDTEANHGNP